MERGGGGERRLAALRECRRELQGKNAGRLEAERANLEVVVLPHIMISVELRSVKVKLIECVLGTWVNFLR